MKPFKNISDKWNQFGQGALSQQSYDITLPVSAAKSFQQLRLKYPRLTDDILLADLLAAALDDFEQSVPYVRGSNVVAIDEMGDEIYEDTGITPKFLKLAKEHRSRLAKAT